MRFGCFAIALMLFLPGASASEWRVPADLPHGGVRIVLPGFTFRSPGYGWTVTNDLPAQDNILFGERWMTFAYDGPGPDGEPDPSATTATFWLGDRNWTGAASQSKTGFYEAAQAAVAAQLASYRENDPSADGSLGSIVSREGAFCLKGGLNATLSGEYGDENTHYSVHSVIFSCMHADNPNVTLTLWFETRWKAGMMPLRLGEEVDRVIDSLEIVPLPYRIERAAIAGRGEELATAAGAVWATYMDFQDSPGTKKRRGGVVRIDPATNAVVARIPFSVWPSKIVAAPDGVWVATGTALKRIDTGTNTVTKTVDLSKETFTPISGGRFLWAWCHGAAGFDRDESILRIDPRSGAVTEIRQPGGRPRGIFYAGDKLYIYAEGGVMMIDPESLKLTGSMTIERGMPRYDGRYLWNLVPTETFVPADLSPDGRPIPKRFSLRLDRIDLNTPEAVPLTVLRHTLPSMFGPSDFLWWRGQVCMLINGAVACVNPDAPEAPSAIIPNQGILFGSMVTQNGSLWALRTFDGSILRLNPK